MPADREGVIGLVMDLSRRGDLRIAYLEKITGFMSGGRVSSKAMFSFGRSVGLLEGALLGFGFELRDVMPRAWMDAAGVGLKGVMDKAEWKRWLKRKAQGRYPGLNVTLKTADCLLMLDYARRSMS
jgi:hypothetical protein